MLLLLLLLSVKQSFQPSRFCRESSDFNCILPLSRFLLKSPHLSLKIEVIAVQTIVDLNDNCGNGTM